MRRKLLSIVLCVCMMLTMAPFAFAEGDSGDSTNDNVSTTSGASGSGSGTVTQAVAQIDNTTYNTLSDAIAAAENGKTITLLSNTSGQVKIPTNKDITLDLNGNTITHTGTTVYNLGKLTICDSSNDKSGKIISTGNVGVGVGHDSTTTIEYATIEAVEGAVITGYATGATITINDGKFSASDNAVIAGNGNNTDNNATGKPVRVNPNKINILGGTFTGNIQTNGYIACGIYAPWKDIITVSGGNFIVNNGIGIVARAGQVIVTGGSFTCNGTAKGKVGDKNFDMDAAQSVYFDASDPAYPAYNSETDYIKLLGGTFSSDVTKYVAENYTCIQNNDKYTVKALNEVAVAKIGDILYPTLAKAIEAVPDDGGNATTVTLIKDSTEDVTIPAHKKVALELNGKTLTNKNGSTITVALGAELTVTGTGTIDNVTHAKAAIWNNGTCTLSGGNYTRTKENGISAENNGGNSFYTVLNHGTMTINDGVTILQNGHYSSLLENGYQNAASGNQGTGYVNDVNTEYPSLTINGGLLTGGLNTVKNDDNGTIAIKNGTFTNYTQSAFQNHHIATINGGTFDGANVCAVLNCGACSSIDATHDKHETTITGGYFNGNLKKTVGTITITGGYFTSDPTAYVASGYAAVETTKPGYNYEVTTAKPTKAEVSTADPDVQLPDNLKSNVAARALQSSLKKATDLVDGDGLTAAAKTIANRNTITKDAATDALKNAGLTPMEGTNVRVVVQTYMDIDITAVGTTSKTLTLDITPMYRTVATTANTDSEIELTGADVSNANAVLVGPAGKLIINKPVTIKIPLPTDFVSPVTTGANDYPSIYVQHKGYEYTASVSNQSGTLYATFTNPHGFSSFTITAAPTAVAEVNGTSYINFQDAVDAVENGGTIKALKNIDSTVSGNKRFKVNANEKTVKLIAASGYNLTENGNTYTVSRQSSGGPGSSGGSISTPTTYAVNVNAATNGAVAADKKTASKGTTVTVTASPSKGYVVDAVKVVDKDGKDVAVTEKDGKYVFTMPASAVTVTGSFKAETPAPAALPFTDVKSGNWFYDAVKYAYEQGLMTGTSATTFAPNGTMNRAMIVTVLYRLEKSPAVTGASKFTDVPAGQWYSDAVAWAAANKIVNGYDETTFGPMNAVTREQMAAILFRYEQVKGLENVTLEENLNRFPDQNKISAYAIPALQWAVGQKIINGNADGTLDPTGTATRAQVAQIFTNLLNK